MWDWAEVKRPLAVSSCRPVRLAGTPRLHRTGCGQDRRIATDLAGRVHLEPAEESPQHHAALPAVPNVQAMAGLQGGKDQRFSLVERAACLKRLLSGSLPRT